MTANSFGNILRRLDRLEAQVGDGDEGYGPDFVIVLTRYWRGAGDGGEDVDRLGALREQRLIDEAVAEVRAEARARREYLGHIVVTVNDRGEAEFDGVLWRRRQPQDLALSSLSWVGDVLRQGRKAE